MTVTHRMRRGRLVEIPEEWRGKTVHPERIARRKSKRGQGQRFKIKATR